MPDLNNAPDPAEAAALYVAGAMTQAEVSWFEARIRANDPAFVSALAKLRGAQGALLWVVEPVVPPAKVKESIMRSLGSQEHP